MLAGVGVIQDALPQEGQACVGSCASLQHFIAAAVTVPVNDWAQGSF